MLLIKTYLRLGRKIDLMNLQFHMAGEALQSRRKARRRKLHLTCMPAGKERESLCRETPIVKMIRSRDTHSPS